MNMQKVSAPQNESKAIAKTPRKIVEVEKPDIINQIPRGFATISGASPSQIPLTSQTISHVQRTIGNRAVGKLIQTKLTIGAPNDKYEQEADRVADQVMRMPDSQVKHGEMVSHQSQISRIQRLCPECEEEMQRQPLEEEEPLQMQAVEEEEGIQRQPLEEEPLQAKQADGGGIQVTPKAQLQINRLRSGGQPLPASSRSYFEPRFGYDFSGVRVHAGNEAATMARSINARAFTVGRDVAFGAGQYSPGTSSGKKLLAHELTHVVQQGETSGVIKRFSKVKSSNKSKPKSNYRVQTPPVSKVQIKNTLGRQEQLHSATLQRQADLSKAPPGLPCNLAPNVTPPVGTKIDFRVGRSVLTGGEVAKVTAFTGSWAAAGARDDVMVAGYASVDGSQDLNWRISCQRAQAVANELVTKGIPREQIHIWAHGETKAFSAKSLQPNRRVVIAKIAPAKLAPTLKGKGAPVPPAFIPSAAGPFGKWQIDQTVTNGTVHPGGAGNARYSSNVTIKYSPDRATVNCKEIAFVQAVRLIDAKGVSADTRANFQARMTKTGWTVDRLDQRKYGWYGYNNNGKPSGTIQPGSSPKPLTDARLSDTPGWNVPNLQWDFETCAICKTGTQNNLIYGSLTWGFDVDAANKLTKHRPVEYKRPTAEFLQAVVKWNVQATGPAANRNAPNQQKLDPFSYI